ncbi:LOW QUALITY PROTEIN: Protein FAR1-RELATED SEQUENCE 5 [Frankliniella fusca]|uniref:Protein FAR1-RELATED SEQUENCE 5 n=1 Tax=Frankliniella fusca TaxID=407009 RepID=A0AAE1HY38_9NEOP|nr:LOW QUALITY PROTEIN: Protein FAR1-RELATED SEQUENCE 5 [Frankliniella fusca]
MALHEVQRFASFEEFEAALNKYSQDNDMVFVTGHSSSIKIENKKLAARTFKIGCPFMEKIFATKTHLVVDKFISIHENHDPSPGEKKIIPKARTVHQNDQATSDILCAANVRPARIRMMLRETPAGRPKRKREEANGRSEKQMLEDTLCQILESDPGAYIHISKDEDGRLISICIQTSRMRKNVKEFGLVLLFYHTYKINKNRLPLSILKVMDGNGVGRCAGVGYVVNEEKSTLSNIIGEFTESIRSVASERTRTVVTDKDWSEAGAIRERCPMPIFTYVISMGETLFRPNVLERQVKGIVDELRYFEESSTFDKLCKELKEVASENFYTYFEKNWINSIPTRKTHLVSNFPLPWSYRDKKKSPNLGNTTNNRLEISTEKPNLLLDEKFYLMLLEFKLLKEELLFAAGNQWRHSSS